MSLDLHQEVSTFLALCRTASLATADASGVPHAACVQFAADAKWRLIWVSAVSSAHSCDIEERRRCAVTVYGHDDHPEMIHGIQMQGRACLLADDDRDEAIEVYSRRFPFVYDEPYASAIERGGIYRFTPTWLRWLDNRRGFGFKVEQTLG